MRTIEEALQPITGYLISMTRNTKEGWYEFQVGIPSNWVFDNNEEITCEILNQSDAGKLVKVSPKVEGVTIDDLVAFVEIIIQTNERISAKEKEFTDKMEQMKQMLENEAKKFYQELDELKEKSFKSLEQTPVKIDLSEKKKKKVVEPKPISGVTN
jgi:phenylalanyl-tRNA synthetase alpha subunit